MPPIETDAISVKPWTIKGKIATKIKGGQGFGWDPIFIPQGKNKTFAEMTSEEKNSLSMRKIALEALRTKLAIR